MLFKDIGDHIRRPVGHQNVPDAPLLSYKALKSLQAQRFYAALSIGLGGAPHLKVRYESPGSRANVQDARAWSDTWHDCSNPLQSLHGNHGVV